MRCDVCSGEIEWPREKYFHAHDKTVLHVTCPTATLRQVVRAHNAVMDMQEDLGWFGLHWDPTETE